MMNEQEMIVIGGGLVGKTAALAFSQKGFKVLHIASHIEPKNVADSNKSFDTSWESRVYAISSSSQKLLKQLQVWDALPQERIQVVSDMKIYGDDPKGNHPLHFSAFEAAVPQLAWIVEASAIERGVDLASRFSQSLTRVQAEVEDIQIDENQVIVSTNQGKFTGGLIIAADGANSPTREKFGIEVCQQDYVQSAVIANLACSQNHLQTAYQWFLPGGDVLALLPLPNKKVSVVWSTYHEHAQTLMDCAANSPEEFCERITASANGLVAAQLGSLQLLNSVKSYPLRKIRAKNLIGPAHEPRVVLVGDSAHVMHPLAGQGLNLGLRDIADLLQVLSARESFRPIHDPVLLRRYERMRAADIDSILGVTHHLHQLFLKTSPPIRWLRNLGLKIVDQHQLLKKEFVARALG
jgi:ubiquinone biosynthesis UbiH/UbiF/VisC/COQ6 family hydroxylase